MKSIKTKMILVVCLVIALSLSLVGGTVSILMYNSSISSLSKTMSQTASVAAELVSEYMRSYEVAASEVGLISSLSDPTVSVREKTEILNERITQYGFLTGNITDTRGRGVLYDVDISDRDYFAAAMNGKPAISNVLLSKSLNQYTVVISAPLWKDGMANGTVAGAVYFNVDVKELSNITNTIKVGTAGGAFILDKDSYTIAHQNIQLVLDRDNIVENVKTNPDLADLAALEAKMTAGQTDFGIYSYNGVSKLLAFAPINTGQGWSIAINAELSEFVKDTVAAITITAVLVILFILVGITISIILANSITRPLAKIEIAAAQMATGNFDVEISHRSSDEIGRLAQSMRQTMITTKAVILDTVRGLGEIANGNFDIYPEVEYNGVYKGIETAMVHIITGLSHTVSEIKNATHQVASGSEQVSSGAQALAQGATEQANAVEELSTAIAEISRQIQGNATHAATANEHALEARDGLMTSNQHMSDMMGAMTEISSSSVQISKIIKTIEDIAFQTNILALNAAVEAARAGAAGKGFAVVADEVRNLATKSSEAAKQTNVLIEGSVTSVARGVTIADSTAKSLGDVVTIATALTALITRISEATAEQSSTIAQITQGVDQISSVVQTNSATSEESAAASEELNGQANMMRDLVGKFQLLKTPVAGNAIDLYNK